MTKYLFYRKSFGLSSGIVAMIKSAMVNESHKYSAVIVDAKGTVEVFDGVRRVVLTPDDYELAKASRTSPFSRVFQGPLSTRPIIIPDIDLRLQDL